MSRSVRLDPDREAVPIGESERGEVVAEVDPERARRRDDGVEGVLLGIGERGGSPFEAVYRVGREVDLL